MILTMMKIYACAFILPALNIVEMVTLDIIGQVGENVTFNCSNWNVWFSINTNTIKYLCESPCSNNKHIIIKAASGETKFKNRIQITNKANYLSVTFTNLKLSDSKTYYCRVERYGIDPRVEVNLKVIDGPKTPANTLTAGSAVSFAVLNRTNMSSSNLDTITKLSVLYTTLHITPTASTVQEDESVPYLTLGVIAIILMLTLMVMLKFMRTVKRQLKVVSSADSPQEDAQVDVEYDEIGPEDQQTVRPPVTALTSNFSRVNTDADPQSPYANYTYLQNSQSAVQNDSVYSIAQLPKHNTEPNGQSESTQSNVSEIDSAYSLICYHKQPEHHNCY